MDDPADPRYTLSFDLLFRGVEVTTGGQRVHSYAEQVKGSNNLAPFEYSASEQARIDAGEKVFPHILGTDRMGRDFAVRIMMGTRVSLSVGLIASVLVLIIGATYGAVAAFAGGWSASCRALYSRHSAKPPR